MGSLARNCVVQEKLNSQNVGIDVWAVTRLLIRVPLCHQHQRDIVYYRMRIASLAMIHLFACGSFSIVNGVRIDSQRPSRSCCVSQHFVALSLASSASFGDLGQSSPASLRSFSILFFNFNCLSLSNATKINAIKATGSAALWVCLY